MAYGLIQIGRESADYPAHVENYLCEDAPDPITVLGNPTLLDLPKTAVFASSRAPGAVLDATYGLAQHLREAGRPVVSGFHSALEKEVLAVLLRSQVPILVCPARGIASPRMPAAWRPAFESGRLALLSPFDPATRRATRDLARQRNRFAASLADQTWIAHAAPGGSLFSLAQDVLANGRPLHTLPDPANQPLLTLGAVPPQS